MKKNKLIKILVYFIILLFVFSYLIEKSGYYEYNLQNKKNLTEEEIKRFEEDVKEGKNVDINEYLKDNKVDYSNNLTRKVSNFSINVNKYLKVAISKTFNIFEKLVK